MRAALDFTSKSLRPRASIRPTHPLPGKRAMAEDAYFGTCCRRFRIPAIGGGAVRLPRPIARAGRRT